MAADRNVPRGFTCPQPDFGLEPLPVGIDEVDRGDRGLTDIGCKARQVVELRFPRSIHDTVTVESFEPLDFIDLSTRYYTAHQAVWSLPTHPVAQAEAEGARFH